MTDHRLESPGQFTELIMGNDMYLMTDGDTVFDRYGNPVER